MRTRKSRSSRRRKCSLKCWKGCIERSICSGFARNASPRGRAQTKHCKVTPRTIHCFTLFLSPMMMHTPAMHLQATIWASTVTKEYPCLSLGTHKYFQKYLQVYTSAHESLELPHNSLFHTFPVTDDDAYTCTHSAMHLARRRRRRRGICKKSERSRNFGERKVKSRISDSGLQQEYKN